MLTTSDRGCLLCVLSDARDARFAPQVDLRDDNSADEAPDVGVADESVELSDEQQAAVEAALGGANLFVTGSAGVGKSLLVTRIVQKLEREANKASLPPVTLSPSHP
eukprot:1803450-Pyramimonas_sp.AAC.1